MDKSRIKNQACARQVIDYRGVNLDNYIYPSDIDGLIEYKDSEYILFEGKYRNKEVPKGQRVALERMVDDFQKIGKKAIAIVFEHNVESDKPVIAAICTVREVYYGSNVWIKIKSKLKVKDAVNAFHNNRKLKGVVKHYGQKENEGKDGKKS